jgi:hypothetical protein
VTARPAFRTRLAHGAAVAVFGLVVPHSAAAQLAVQVRSLGPAEGYPSAAAAWLYISYPMSVDCSPPRACYAKSQWLHAYVHCYTRSVAVLERISMDLNGDVVATAKADAVLFRGTVNDPGASAALVELCGDARDRDDVPPRHRQPRYR